MSLKDIKDAFLSIISTLEFIDIIDVAILAYIIYMLLKLIRETRAGQLVKGILFLVAGYFISNFLGLKTITYILKQTLDIGLIAMIILFQPELRRALEKAGRTKLGVRIFGLGQNTDESTKIWEPAIEAICDSCVELSATCTGALIVVERQVRLGEQIETGTILNATPSKEVFGNIFYPKTPLHDGAVTIRGNRVSAATCYLDLTKSQYVSKELGTRHRAGIGVSEEADCVAIIVSEETGKIAVAHDGQLERNLTEESLRQYLTSTLTTPEEGEDNNQGKKRRRRKA